MKKIVSIIAAVIISLAVVSCGGKKKSASSIAQEWCELNGKVAKAEGPAKEAAEAAKKKFETEMKDKYQGDEAFMKEIGKEVEKCEDASEGR